VAEFPGVGGGVIGTVVGLIGSITGLWRGYKVDSFIGAIVSGLSNIAKALAQAFTTFVLEMRLFLAKLVAALARLWNVVLRPLLHWAKEKFLSVTAWLKRTFAPLIRLIDRLRKEWRLFYTRILRPILDTIDIIRFFLRELGRLGVGWASDLDKTLARIQDKIQADWEWVYGHLNEIRNVIDRIVTLDYLIQRLVFLRTLDRDAPIWVRMWWTRSLQGPSVVHTSYELTRDYPTHFVQEDVNALTDYFTDGGGEHGAIIGELSLMFMKAVETEPGAVFETTV
jgi:hypothetical protein